MSEDISNQNSIQQSIPLTVPRVPLFASNPSEGVIVSLPPEEEDTPIIEYDLNEEGFAEVFNTETEAPRKVFPFGSHRWADLRSSCCKFDNRGCLVKNWRLLDRKKRQMFLESSMYAMPDNTVFPVPESKRKHQLVQIADTKVMKCANTKCTRVDHRQNIVPVTFHYCCYVGMIEREKIGHLEFDIKLDSLTDIHKKEMVDTIGMDIVEKNQIIMPVCGKNCYNIIQRERKKKIEAENKKAELKERVMNSMASGERSTVQWDSDGINGKMSSEEVIVSWLSTAENAEKYFGGSYGAQKKVNGVSKDTYHTRLSNMIHRENGQLRSPQSVKCKIDHILNTYKAAVEEINQSGNGLDTENLQTFMEYIHTNICRYYTVLNPVMQNRPNIWAAYTNETHVMVNVVAEAENRTEERFIELSGDEDEDEDEEEEEEGGNTAPNETQTRRPCPNTVLERSDTMANSARSLSNCTSRRERESPKKKARSDKEEDSYSKAATNKITLIDANKTRRDTRKTIRDKKSNGDMPGFLFGDDDSHIEKIMTAHHDKMKLKADLHAEKMKIENARLLIEQTKVNRETSLVQLQEERLKGEIIKEATEYNFDIIKKRLECKKIDPSITDECLDEVLPFRVVPK